MTDLKRITRLEPGYDARDKGCGVHGVNLRMLLVGPLGAVQFLLYTGWTPESVGRMSTPMAAHLGYHSPRPMYAEQYPKKDECEFVGGGQCFYDGSPLGAEKPWRILREEGEDGVWRFLEAFYREVFIERTQEHHDVAN